MKGRVLIVDDEVNVRRSLQGVLEDSGYEVQTLGSGEECIDVLDETTVDAVLLDVWLPGKDGLEVLEEIDSFEHYERPEILPNGDIIIRRREDAPPLLLDDGKDPGEKPGVRT